MRNQDPRREATDVDPRVSLPRG
ncbi:hypothetical protein E2C01_077621 [Portunus trituberculatus]|uniref:Uncharacterized protein n=1 Tax=Portunus trituberculatus TaxID=210409 RepID=A0A5B7IGH6_PORTR|nr:hypothetical protein [Portunus trituberculatus]